MPRHLHFSLLTVPDKELGRITYFSTILLANFGLSKLLRHEVLQQRATITILHSRAGASSKPQEQLTTTLQARAYGARLCKGRRRKGYERNRQVEAERRAAQAAAEERIRQAKRGGQKRMVQADNTRLLLYFGSGRRQEIRS